MTKRKTIDKAKRRSKGDCTDLPLDKIEGVGVAWDGCHKIYVCESQDDIDVMPRLGYEIYDMGELESIWAKSCPLRFIDSADLTKCFRTQNLDGDDAWD